MSTPEQSFAAFLEAARPVLHELVIVGGWAHRLHRLQPTARVLPYPPLMTYDVDIALDASPGGSGLDIGRRLQDAGFEIEPVGDHRPPVLRYRLGGDPTGFYVEFLTPLRGAEVKRSGRPDVTVNVAGVSAQRLRYVEVLLARPWTMRLDGPSGFSLPEPAVVRVPNPASFIAQKLLIHERRGADRPKDLVYMHDTIELFSANFDAVRDEWDRYVVPGIPGAWLRRVRSAARNLYREANDDMYAAIQEAKAAGRDLPVELLLGTGRAGLEKLFV